MRRLESYKQLLQEDVADLAAQVSALGMGHMYCLNGHWLGAAVVRAATHLHGTTATAGTASKQSSWRTGLVQWVSHHHHQITKLSHSINAIGPSGFLSAPHVIDLYLLLPCCAAWGHSISAAGHQPVGCTQSARHAWAQCTHHSRAAQHVTKQECSNKCSCCCCA
jgi:hypothetical protein